MNRRQHPIDEILSYLAEMFIFKDAAVWKSATIEMESIEIITNLNLKNKLAWTCPGTKGRQMQILRFCDLKLE